jgi:phosphatidylglycerol lysyltransferase
MSLRESGLDARELVMAYGASSTAYQILNPGIEHWFAPEIPAVVGYKRDHRVLLAAGAPVCPRSALAEAIDKFEQFARQRGCHVCYVCAEAELREVLGRSPAHSAVTIGAQPIWRPARWAGIVRSHSSLRAQLHRAVNKGVTIQAMAPEAGREHPALRRVLEEWLAMRALPPLHFLTEPRTLRGVVRDRILLVAWHGGDPVGFLVASPIAARRGYLIEQVVRSRRAPNGTSELLIDAAMGRFALHHSQFVTLGLVALTSKADGWMAQNPWWLRVMMLAARTHANRFYNFRGIEHFRMKMAPEAWEPIYAISNERRFSISTLYALGQAFSEIAPWYAIALAIMKGARQEVQHAAALFSRRHRGNAHPP